jgi:hypothetical protein
MPIRLKSRCLALLGLLALVGGLVLAAGARADNKKPLAPPKQTPEQKQAADRAKKEAAKKKHLAEAETNGKLAEAIKEAYILLAAANADYGGHRARAMHHVRAAATTLDKEIQTGAWGAAQGSIAQKIKALQQDSVAARAGALAKYGVSIKENQPVSDALVLRSGVMLKELVPVLIKTKHPGVLASVRNALKEVDLALAKR